MSINRANMASQIKGGNKSRKFFNDFKREHGRRHLLDPRHAMNAESTKPRPRGMKHGGATCRGMGAATQGGNFKVS